MLKSIDALSVDVDISKYDKDTELDVPIKVPKGINKLEPEIVKVRISTSEKKKKRHSAILK